MPESTRCSFWRWKRLRRSTRVDSTSTTSRSRCSSVACTCGPSWSAKSHSGSAVMPEVSRHRHLPATRAGAVRASSLRRRRGDPGYPEACPSSRARRSSPSTTATTPPRRLRRRAAGRDLRRHGRAGHEHRAGRGRRRRRRRPARDHPDRHGRAGGRRVLDGAGRVRVGADAERRGGRRGGRRARRAGRGTRTPSRPSSPTCTEQMGLIAADGRGGGARGARRPGAGAQGARRPGARRRPGRAAVAVDGRGVVVPVLRGRRDRAADPVPARQLVARGRPARRRRRAVRRRRGDVAVHRQAVVVRRRAAAAVRGDRRGGDVTWSAR